jgi:hypothetical protein
MMSETSNSSNVSDVSIPSLHDAVRRLTSTNTSTPIITTAAPSVNNQNASSEIETELNDEEDDDDDDDHDDRSQSHSLFEKRKELLTKKSTVNSTASSVVCVMSPQSVRQATKDARGDKKKKPETTSLHVAATPFVAVLKGVCGDKTCDKKIEESTVLMEHITMKATALFSKGEELITCTDDMLQALAVAFYYRPLGTNEEVCLCR